MKAMSTPIKILTVVIVLMIVMVVILAVFSGGIQNVSSVLNSWLESLFSDNGDIKTCAAAGGECIPPGTECRTGILPNVCTQTGYICCKA